MICKTECFKLLDRQKEKIANNVLEIHKINDWTDTELIKKVIQDSANGEEAYIKIGELLAETESTFEDIIYREDCYEYLVKQGVDENEAYQITKTIRRGLCHFRGDQIPSDKLSDEFCQWAKGVKYLPGRILLKDMFEVISIYKKVAVEEFDKFYYRKLKKTLPEKIKNGEIEWIYSYGDKLIASGYKSVYDVVKTIVETKGIDNMYNKYIETDVLYEKCRELYEKYSENIIDKQKHHQNYIMKLYSKIKKSTNKDNRG